MKIKVYQKPTCTTCRTVVHEMADAGEDFECVNYFETPLTAETLKSLCDKMGVRPKDILRTKEPIYRELNLKNKELPDDELIGLMVAHPELIQRPILEMGDKVVLARPVENWKRILEG